MRKLQETLLEYVTFWVLVTSITQLSKAIFPELKPCAYKASTCLTSAPVSQILGITWLFTLQI